MKNKNKQTKFPVARIKKIMQKDEEVGKVAQATPIVISKALELFLGLIIDEANKVTTERGAKKVEAYHLSLPAINLRKHAVDTTEILDFLKEIVEAVPDPSAGGTIDLDSENAEGKKKRGKGKKAGATGEPGPRKRRRKKGDAEAEVEIEGAPEPDGGMKLEHEQEHEDVAVPAEGGDEWLGKNDRGGSGSRRRSSDSEIDDWHGDKPFMPRR